ncbi:MAG: N-acetylneuraminate synthase family protein [Thermoleophilia bacterium]
MRIGGTDLDEQVLVVAEIGNNHEGDLDVAKALVVAAALAGADAVKLQVYRADRFANPNDAKRRARLEAWELAPGAVAEIARLARACGVALVATPLDLASVTTLAPLVDAFKVASGDNDFLPLLDAIARTRKPVIVSSGMSTLATIEASARRVRATWAELGHHGELAVLHCVSAYPAPEEESGLAAIPLLQRRLRCPIGWSDHTLGVDVCELAVAAGARIVEKHVTLAHDFSDFRDHALSAEPDELAELVRRVRRVETVLGRPEKTIRPCEEETAALARRSIVAARDLQAGHVLTDADLTWMRPANGLRPGDEELVLGHALVRPIGAGHPILPSDVADAPGLREVTCAA